MIIRSAVVVTSLALTGALPLLACSAAHDEASDSNVGQASIALANVPAGVACFRVRANGPDRSVEQRFDVAPGDDTSAGYFMNRLPVGTVTFVGDATTVPCGQIDTTTTRTWLSDPEAVNISATSAVTVNLVLRPNGRATVGADFEGDVDGGATPHIVTTLAGLGGARGSVDAIGPNARFNDTPGVALDGAGNLYVADMNNQTIRKIVIATGQVTTWAGHLGVAGSTDGVGTAATFASPFGLCADASNLYVLGTDNTVRKVAFANAQVTTLAGTAGQSGAIDAIGAAARFAGPAACTAGDAGNIYVTDPPSFTVRRIATVNGQVTTIAGTAGQSGNVDASGAAARFAQPWAIAFASGNLFIGDTWNQTIRKLVLATSAVTTIAGNGSYGSSDGAARTTASLATPNALAVDPKGNLWIADSVLDTIRMLDAAGTSLTTIAGTVLLPGAQDGTPRSARFNNPAGLAIDAQGTIYVADEVNSVIRKM